MKISDDDKLTRSINILQKYYIKALDNNDIQKPMAWALYQTWRFMDGVEKPRKVRNETEIKK